MLFAGAERDEAQGFRIEAALGAVARRHAEDVPHRRAIERELRVGPAKGAHFLARRFGEHEEARQVLERVAKRRRHVELGAPIELLAARQEEEVANIGQHAAAAVAGVAVATGIYFVLFEPLGYAISTSLFMLVTTLYFNKGKTMTNVLTSVLYSFGSYYAFSKLLGVNLPAGLLPF